MQARRTFNLTDISIVVESILQINKLMVSEAKHIVKMFISFFFSLLLEWERDDRKWKSSTHHMVNRGHHYRWIAANQNIRWALIAIEQWGCLACHTYYDTGHPFIMVISEDPWHSHLLPRFSSGAVTTCFKTWVCRGSDSNIQPYACWANTLL